MVCLSQEFGWIVSFSSLGKEAYGTRPGGWLISIISTLKSYRSFLAACVCVYILCVLLLLNIFPNVKNHYCGFAFSFVLFSYYRIDQLNFS